MNISRKYCNWLKINISFLLGVIFFVLAAPLSADFIFPQGETILYDIKKMGVKAGSASIVFKGKVMHEGKEYALIVFTAQAFNFLDEEKIYVDPVSFYPLRVERNLNIFGKKEKIREEYDQQTGRLTIVKEAGRKTVEQVIEKKPPLDNIYCFIFRYRKTGKFNPGEVWTLHLPTKDVRIKLEQQGTLKVAGETKRTWLMQSEPKEYKVWFDAGSERIPLRIDGAMGLAKTSMIFRSYQK